MRREEKRREEKRREEEKREKREEREERREEKRTEEKRREEKRCKGKVDNTANPQKLQEKKQQQNKPWLFDPHTPRSCPTARPQTP